MARTKIKIDLTRISLKEYRSLFKPGQPRDEEDAILIKVFGFESVDDMENKLNPMEFKQLVADMFEKFRKPIESDEKN